MTSTSARPVPSHMHPDSGLLLHGPPLFSTTAAANGIDVQTLGITADGKTDITSASKPLSIPENRPLLPHLAITFLARSRFLPKPPRFFFKKSTYPISPASFLYTESLPIRTAKNTSHPPQNPFLTSQATALASKASPTISTPEALTKPTSSPCG
ncbi:hypothetical protein Ga0100230_018090 [Opitutaceae bacterium TAV3]|nr:hypothetical protein Ga0100230_018090 [Opitutaceae bacterium TAV3]